MINNSDANISDNVKRIRENIANAAIEAGRDPNEIMLVAASKTKATSEIRQAIAAGVDAVGENRVQEMLVKHSEDAYSGAPLHFIGNLQSNKVNKVVGVCDLIESVGSQSLLLAIAKRAKALGIVQNVLLEVNVGREPQKGGIFPENLEEVLEVASKIDGINVHGLMAIPPFYDEKERFCYYFDIIFKLFIDISTKKYDNVSVRLLSMGMSDSYIEAIRCGSNIVRIGTALFGKR